jgi:hypothetical protein
LPSSAGIGTHFGVGWESSLREDDAGLGAGFAAGAGCVAGVVAEVVAGDAAGVVPSVAAEVVAVALASSSFGWFFLSSAKALEIRKSVRKTTSPLRMNSFIYSS